MKIKKHTLILVILAILGITFFTDASYASDIDDEIDDIRGGMQGKQDKINELKRQIALYEKNIQNNQSKAYTLKNQLETLDIQTQKTELDVELKKLEIESVTQNISLTLNEINDLDLQVKALKKNIGELLYELYIAKETTPLEMFILNDTLSDFFESAQFLESISGNLKKKTDTIKMERTNADEKRITLEEEKTLLENFKEDLEERKEKLLSQKTAKSVLLSETQQNETKFKSLLDQIRAEQKAIDNEIKALEIALRQKLLEKAELENSLDSFKDEKFIWPVPKNVITARFHDPEYPYRHIFEHPAIDIRAKQGTPVKAAGSGYVGKVQSDPGCKGGYAYIMIVHADGLSTVYGHVSRIDVKEEEFVMQGQQIGLSGASPGTCGAGRLTTGPHMHFEVRKNGIPQNPINYLP